MHPPEETTSSPRGPHSKHVTWFPGPRPFSAFVRRILALGGVLAVAALLLVELAPRTAFAQSSCGPDTHQPGTDPEVLVGTTPTRMPQLCGRGGVELQNLGPNPIWCVISYNSAHARVNRARRVDPNGGTFPANVKDTQPVWCVASTAAQVQGAATIVSEAR